MVKVQHKKNQHKNRYKLKINNINIYFHKKMIKTNNKFNNLITKNN
jgi:hypothetical protein